jgi:hypothetical protein
MVWLFLWNLNFIVLKEIPNHSLKMKKQNFTSRIKQHFFIVFCVLFSLCVYPQSNLLLNADFENGFSSWTILKGANRVNLDSKSGSYALSAPSNSGAEQTITGLTPNTTYLLTGWLKSSNSSPVSLGVKLYGGNELSNETTSTVYKQLTVKFTTGPSSTKATIYAYNPSSGSNTMNVDDLPGNYLLVRSWCGNLFLGESLPLGSTKDNTSVFFWLVLCRSWCLFCHLIVFFCLFEWDPGVRRGNIK